MADRLRLLAGSVGPERVPARPDPDDADWFLPLHVRAAATARERLAAQVAAGADVVVAPTWLTHRRALLPIGETRRAGPWTEAAVRVAREAVELGLQRREEALANVPPGDARHGRPVPLVAASLPALDETPDAGGGRLLPEEAAGERDYRDQAGHLADAEPDLLLVEGQRGEAVARIAIAEAVQTGLPTWAALSEAALAVGSAAGWLEWGHGTGVHRFLLPPPLEARLEAADGGGRWGGLLRAPDGVAEWLEAGADTIACLDGASPPVLDRLRVAIDEHERDRLEADRRRDRRWEELVERAAAMAPGGPALWIGDAPATLPGGYRWLSVRVSEVRRLPHAHFRLIVAPEAPAGVDDLLDQGGLLVTSGPAGHAGSGLRHLIVDEGTPRLLVLRRDD